MMTSNAALEGSVARALSVSREIIPVERSTFSDDTPVKQATDLWFKLYDAAGGIPDFATFHPFEHPKLLPHLSIFERIGKRYFCSLIGETARNSLPEQIAKRYLDEAMPPEIAEDIAMRFDRVHEDGLPNYVERRMTWTPDHDFMQYRVLNAPFVCSKNKTRRVMSILDFETPVL